jgi:SSS family solute:Na+ symporter
MALHPLVWFLLITTLVALFSWRNMSRPDKNETAAAHFLGNRSFGFVMVGGLLFLTNVNGVQFVGENESVYLNNMSVMAWGITSVPAMILVAEFFMPIYLRSRVVTTPDFLEQRYDASTKQTVSIIFLLSYLLNMLPSVLYGGAVVFNGLFHLSDITGLENHAILWLIIWSVGIIGSFYTIIGGIRVVAVSDVLLGSCLFIAGLCVPFFGLKYLGGGSFSAGLSTVLSSKTEHLNAIGSATDPVPFSTLFTGMLLVNLYYWGTEQYIVQRTLVSKNLAESQKGLALAAVGKLISPLMLNIPGIIGVHLYATLDNSAEVFPRLAADVLPPILTGLIAAVILGASVTSFNAGLSSVSTLFVLNLYKPLKEKRGETPNDRSLIRIGKRFQMFAALCGMLIAPFIAFADHGFYSWLQKVGGAFSVPIFTVLFIGFVTRRVPPIAAKIGLFFFVGAYLFTQLIWDTGLHFLHILAILFVVTTALMLLIGRLWPLETPWQQIDRSVVDIQPWRGRWLAYGLLLAATVGVYVVFSGWGLLR